MGTQARPTHNQSTRAPAGRYARSMPLADHAHRPPRAAVFLDRDDTLNENGSLPDAAFPHTRGDLFSPDHVRLLPGVADACQRLAGAGFALVVVTNQASVARGGATIDQIEATNDRLRELLTRDGRCLLDAVYAAPHHPNATVDGFRGDHPWRKPGPGMVLAAAEELRLDLSRSWLVGDAARDIESGVAAGLDPSRCVRIGPDGDLPTLTEAADLILAGAGTDPDPAPEPDPEPALHAVPASVATLRARAPGLLDDPAIARTVEAAAHALAERTGMTLLAFQIEPTAVRATLAGSRIATLGFMAELRRTTNAWHAARTTGPGTNVNASAGLWYDATNPDQPNPDQPDPDDA